MKTSADLLRARTARGPNNGLPFTSLDACTGRFVDLQNLALFPSRLRRLIIHSVTVKLTGHKGYEEAGAESFSKLLN